MLVERLKEKGINVFFNHEPTTHTPFGRLARCTIERNTCLPADISEAEWFGATDKFKALIKIAAKINKGQVLTEIERQTLYIADRHEDLRETIKPAISRGLTCVQDRYELSTYAFASTKSISFSRLKKMHDEMLHDVYIVPDVLLYFDLEPEIAVDRLKKALSKPVDIYETLPKIEKTRTTYKKLLRKKELFKEFHVIDARPPLLEVFQDICSKLNI